MNIELNEHQFIGLPVHPLGETDMVFLPVPYERTVTYGVGTAGGPARLLEASDQLETFDEISLIDLETELRQRTVAPPSIKSHLPPEDYLDRLSAHVARFRTVPLQIGIGGEHTITYALARGRFGDLSRVTFVWIDAHADCIDKLEGRRWSHGTVARRIREEGAHMILIGVRSLSREEYHFAQADSGIDAFFAHRLDGEWDRLLATLRDVSGDVYLSLDVDGLDPSVIPSTGTPQPGGLSWNQTCELIETLFCAPRAAVRAADLVEFIPSPHPPGCDLTAAKLLMRMVCAWIANRR